MCQYTTANNKHTMHKQQSMKQPMKQMTVFRDFKSPFGLSILRIGYGISIIRIRYLAPRMFACDCV